MHSMSRIKIIQTSDAHCYLWYCFAAVVPTTRPTLSIHTHTHTYDICTHERHCGAADGLRCSWDVIGRYWREVVARQHKPHVEWIETGSNGGGWGWAEFMVYVCVYVYINYTLLHILTTSIAISRPRGHGSPLW